MTKRPRALFFGTPAFAVPCLEALTEIADVVGVVCQPDRPVGRGLAVTMAPTKLRATELGIPFTQPTKLRTGEFADWMRAQQVDVAVVVAYGRILPQDVLDAPRLGCVNVHASLLPRFRGAAPIQWAVVRGERETGITLMQMDAGMDTGAMLEQFRTPIGPDETAGGLAERLSRLGADAVRTGLPRVFSGDYEPVAQEDAKATAAPPLKKEDGQIDWRRPAQGVHDHVRGMSPWPGAFTSLHVQSPSASNAQGLPVKVHVTHPRTLTRPGAQPGEVLLADKSGVIVACGDGSVELALLQLPGKKPVSGPQWVAGRGVREGDRLG